jgi:kynurenine formamidase
MPYYNLKHILMEHLPNKSKITANTAMLFITLVFIACCYLFTTCTSNTTKLDLANPKEIIDLGCIVTEDLTEKVWGKAMMAYLGFDRPNHFDVIEWKFDMEDGSVSGSNAYYTIFNHGGPHIDAPNHMDLGGGLDTYPIESYMGPVKVFDVSHYDKGHTVPIDVFRDKVSSGDIVLVFTNYIPPQTEDAFPEVITLTYEASEYLASIPVRAFGTDAFSVMSTDDEVQIDSDSEAARVAPIHYSFLSRKIPIYEGLFQLDRLLSHQNMHFIGVPLNIKDGDGMLVRPVVLVF